MENKIKVTNPKYKIIAADIASKVASGQYKIGNKIYASSSLAGQYSVSSETVRRAICILSELNIVESTKGSGVVIKSYDNAIKFLKQYEDTSTISSLKSDIINSINTQKTELDNITNTLSQLLDKVDRVTNNNPFIIFQIDVNENTKYLNSSLSEINFWHNTSATIIGIKRNNEILMSPGPYATLMLNDIFYFVGDETCYERVKKFLYD